MSDKASAWDRLLDLIDVTKASDAHNISPQTAIADAIRESVVNAPSLRHCLYPGCLREFDMTARMNGREPARPSWSGDGWHQATRGVSHGNICPDHVAIVTDHLASHVELPNGRWTLSCACTWMPAPQTWSGMLRPMWEQHLLTAAGELPAAPPIPDPDIPGTRIPLAEHTDATLAELYDRLWDAEADRAETRDTARSCILAYTAAVPALLGARTALEALRTRITLDSRDWTHDKLDAWLWALLVGANCENTDPAHVHNDIDCAGDQGLWDLARQHDIPMDQTIRASQLRWWIANAITVAKQIEEQPHV